MLMIKVFDIVIVPAVIGPDGKKKKNMIGLRRIRTFGLMERIFTNLELLVEIFSWRKLTGRHFIFSLILIWTK